MKEFYVAGDTQFNGAHDWTLELGRRYVDWFEGWTKTLNPANTDREIAFAGDLTELAVVDGDVFSILDKLIGVASFAFRTVYLLRGNHDFRIVRGRKSYVADYATRRYPNVAILDEPKVFQSQNDVPLMALPHLYLDDRSNLEKYYNEGFDPLFYQFGPERIVIGHVAAMDPGKKYIGGVDCSKFAATHWALGHIHNRVGKEARKYCGSAAPFKQDEVKTDLPRVIKKFRWDDSNKKVIDGPDVEIPEFIRYREVAFPADAKPTTDDVIEVWTVTNCRSIALARDHYKKLHVKSVKYEVAKAGESNGITVEKIEKLKPLDALNSMIKEEGLVVKRSVMAYIRELFA
jgi:DNA repair exonuclease SbcCD nuclease subunit